MNITQDKKSFTYEDGTGDALKAFVAGTSVAMSTQGATNQPGVGPLLVMTPEERVQFAEWLLQGTNHEVTEIVKTTVLDSELWGEAKSAQTVNSIFGMLSEAGPFSTPTKQAQKLADFLNAEHGTKSQYAVSKGARKYARVTQSQNGKHESVHCFVDVEGNVYKAAGWKTPAKGARGSVNAIVNGLQETDWSGSYLYK